MSVSSCRVRRLIVIAVNDYGDGDTDFAKGIADQVAVVTGWLADPELGVDRVFEPKVSPQTLHSVQQVRQFLDGQDLAAAKRDEAIVVYITGHGQRGSSSGRHYLRFARTDDARLPGTALTTSEVISAALGSSAEHVLVLVDSCFAGALANEVPLVMRDLGVRRKLASLAVVAAGDFDEQPLVGSFTELLNRALDTIGAEESGFAEPYLSFSEWQQVLDSVSRQDRGLVEAQWVWPQKLSQEPSLCLPNPRYQAPQKLGASVRELPDAAGLFAGYWHDRASGRTHEQDAGWYFSGRHEVMRKVAAFVTNGTGVMVVTGAAGSGKSALLARLVTLTDAVFLSQPDLYRVAAAVPEEERPPVGSVDAAVLARNKTSLGLIGDLLRALGIGAVPAGMAPLQLLLEHLTARAQQGTVPTIVIDGLDEAEQTLACLNDVILPMARLRRKGYQPLVRMVLGVRSSRPDAFGTLPGLRIDHANALLHVLIKALADDHQHVPVQVQRTDEPTCQEDISVYVEALLNAGETSPYIGEDERARTTAREIARVVAPSFLDARLAADQLRTADQMQDLTAVSWQERLNQGTVALLHEDVHEVAGHHGVPVGILVRVLRATAFGAGSGLPWSEVWPAVAQALEAPATDPVGVDTYAAVIRTVQTTRLTGYLTTSEEDGRTTYRPVHQQVAEVLVQQPSWLVDASPAARGEQPSLSVDKEQARITDALAALVPSDPPSTPHPYIRRHLVAHAAAGRVLDDDHVPLQLLAQETSLTLREQLGLPLLQEPAHAHLLTVTAAALIEPYLTEDTDAASRRSSIALHHAALTSEDQAGTGAIPAALTPQWGWWESATNVLASLGEHVHALTAVEVPPGRTLLAAGTKTGAHIWDASSGQHLTDLPAGFVQGMCPIRSNSGRPFLATAGSQGVAIWDPLSGLQIARTREPKATGVQVLADGDQRWKLYLRGRSPAIWSPEEDRIEFVSLTPDEENPYLWGTGRQAVIHSEGRQPLFATQTFGHLTLSDLRGNIRVRLPFSGRGLRKLMGVRRPGHGDLVLAATSEHVLTWDPETGQKVYVGAGPAAHLVQIPSHDDRVAIAMERRGSVEVWQWHEVTWQLAATATVGPITALTALSSDQGQWRVATAGEAGLRLWYPTPVTLTDLDDSKPRPVTALAALHAPVDNGSARDLWAIGTTTGVEIADGNNPPSRYLPTGPVRALQALSQGLLAVHTPHGLEVWDPLKDSRVQPVSPQQEERSAFQLPSRTPASCVIDWPPGSATVVTAHPGGVYLTGILHEEKVFVPIQRAASPRAVIAVPAPDEATRWIALGTRGGVLIWNLTAQQAVTELRIRGQSDTRTLAVVREGDTTLLAAATRERIQTWDTATWTVRATIAAPWTKVLEPIPLSAARSLLASGSGHAVRLWDPTTAELLHTLVTAAPIEAITTLRDDDTLLIGVGGPAGFAALCVNISLP
ncbi:AAA family ATPase [Embleya sp. NPDC005971]|uniref:AAA family ATPase n=1 Tax=Embleya sp. NPDC005971 TaxID=3156724 RepID=UPI00340B146B